jgi:serine/threonine protein kinase
MSTEPHTTFTSPSHVYTVVRELGKGGQGRTLLVEREGEAGSRYVLKLLRLEHVDDWKQVELFEREVATLAALDHPGIPRLIDRLEEDGRTTGIVQTFVDGRTLAEQITAHAPIGAARFERILRECLDILAHLHEQVPPVLHRDINPRNVMLGPERTFLIDFGAVRVGGKTDMTSVGTFGYMAPEQLIGRPVPASDMYGLGMTMVSLAERRDVGDLPHDPSTGRVDAARLLQSVEPRVRDVVLAMIEPGVGERLASPREALRRLDAPPVPAVRQSAEIERVAAGPGKLPLRVGIALGVLGLTATVGLMATGSSTKEMDSSAATVQVQVQPPAVVVAPPKLEPMKPPPRQFEPKVLRPGPVEPKEARPEPGEPPPPEPAELTDENSAQLRITTKPSNAMVFIDGKGTCYTPCARRVAFGRHTVRLEHGERAVDRSVRVLEDTLLQVSMVE